MSIGQRSLSDCYSLTHIYVHANIVQFATHYFENTMQTTTKTTPEATEVATANINQTNESHVEQQQSQSKKQVCKHRNRIYYLWFLDKT